MSTMIRSEEEDVAQEEQEGGCYVGLEFSHGVSDAQGALLVHIGDVHAEAFTVAQHPRDLVPLVPDDDDDVADPDFPHRFDLVHQKRLVADR
jgi:hypothetical protein